MEFRYIMTCSQNTMWVYKRCSADPKSVLLRSDQNWSQIKQLCQGMGGGGEHKGAQVLPLQPEWRLLKEHISLEEFEELPFVRSLFFRYQLAFPTEHMKSVMSTDQTGGKLLIENFGIFHNYLLQVQPQFDWKCLFTCSRPWSSITTSSFTTKMQTISKVSHWNAL